MIKLGRFRSLFLPAAIGLTLLVVAGWYYLVWLPAERRYLDGRNFRLLTTLSEQISDSINNFDKMMDNVSDSHISVSRDMLKHYFEQVAPQLKTVESEDHEVIGGDYGDPPHIAVRADEGTHFLYLAFQSTPGKIQHALRTDLNKLIHNLLPPANRAPFDVILVAQSDGTVIFQTPSPGLAVARVGALEDESRVPKTAKPEPIEVNTLLQFSRFSEITLANVSYRLYSLPVQLSLSPIVPGKKSARENARQPERWVLCGLVRADSFRTESQSIPYTFILWATAFILLALVAPPVLKVLLCACAWRIVISPIIP
jgi:hypothetical protein